MGKQIELVAGLARLRVRSQGAAGSVLGCGKGAGREQFHLLGLALKFISSSSQVRCDPPSPAPNWR